MPTRLTRRCNAKFKADNDIAGEGVTISFLLIAWLTCAVSVIACYFKRVDWLKKRLERLIEWHWMPSFLCPCLRLLRRWVNNHSRNQRWYQNFTNHLLIHLCDIQIVTGFAIVVAGLLQLRLQSITFYHQQLVSNFWSIALNSYWAARDASFDQHAGRTRSQVQVRIIAILISVVLGAVFQLIIFIREKRHWDVNESGLCYRSHDRSADSVPILWIIGLGIYAVYLLLYLRSSTAKWMDECLTMSNKSAKKLRKSCLNLSGEPGPRSGALSSVAGKLATLLSALLSGTCAALWYALKRFLSFFCLGDRRHIPEVLAFIGISGWNTFDIVDLEKSNRDLLEASEKSWGFGQFLVVGLLGITVLEIFDSYIVGRRDSLAAAHERSRIGFEDEWMEKWPGSGHNDEESRIESADGLMEKFPGSGHNESASDDEMSQLSRTSSSTNEPPQSLRADSTAGPSSQGDAYVALPQPTTLR